jgi:hypothetical protein
MRERRDRAMRGVIKPAGGIALKCVYLGQGWAWNLRPGDQVEVWDGAELVTILSAELVTALVRHYIERYVRRDPYAGIELPPPIAARLPRVPLALEAVERPLIGRKSSTRASAARAARKASRGTP